MHVNSHEPYVIQIDIDHLLPSKHLVEFGLEDLISRIPSRTLPNLMPYDLNSTTLYRLYDEFNRDGKFINPLIVEKLFEFVTIANFHHSFPMDSIVQARASALDIMVTTFFRQFHEGVDKLKKDDKNPMWTVMVGNQRLMAAKASGYKESFDCIVWEGDRSGYTYQTLFDKFYTTIDGFVCNPR